MNKANYIRSTKVSLKFANTTKIASITLVQDEYNSVLRQFIDIFWSIRDEKIPSMAPKEFTQQIKTWLSARLVQCAGKQASSIVRGTLEKQNRRKFVYQKLVNEGKHKQSRKLKSKIDAIQITKPSFTFNLPMELDERFIKLNFKSQTIFDGWLTVGSIGNGLKIVIPFGKSKHYNKLSTSGVLLKGVRLTSSEITFMFQFERKQSIYSNSTLGIDVGIKNTLSCSNGQQTISNNHNHNLDTIQKILARKKKGSKSFERTQQHRKNFINWSVNQLNLTGVSSIRCEKIRNIRSGRRTNRFLSAWTYADIFAKLERKCEEENVSLIKISPTYTSQRCSACGWVRKSNRKGKLFKCNKCCFSLDADLNAAKNIALNLREIGKKERLLQKNRKGFYWLEEGQEFIVPVILKDKS